MDPKETRFWALSQSCVHDLDLLSGGLCRALSSTSNISLYFTLAVHLSNGFLLPCYS
jgi:hypothetical protein